MDSDKAGTMTVQKAGHAMENSTRFVVEVYDSSTECIATEVKLDVSNVSEFAADLGLAGFESHATYDLNDEDIKRINKRFGLNISVDAGPAKLRAWLDIDDFPYRIHTNRELALMLDGKKPLAVFCGISPPCPGIEEIPERMFAPHVALERFVKRECVEFLSAESTQKVRRVLYALPQETWRIDAYLLLQKTARKVGWSEALEWMEGSLLGYSESENDWHIEWFRQRDKA